jgi:hypothetical protein
VKWWWNGIVDYVWMKIWNLYKVCVVTGETTNTIHQLGMISRAQVTGWCQTP